MLLHIQSPFTANPSLITCSHFYSFQRSRKMLPSITEEQKATCICVLGFYSLKSATCLKPFLTLFWPQNSYGSLTRTMIIISLESYLDFFLEISFSVFWRQIATSNIYLIQLFLLESSLEFVMEITFASYVLGIWIISLESFCI